MYIIYSKLKKITRRKCRITIPTQLPSVCVCKISLLITYFPSRNDYKCGALEVPNTSLYTLYTTITIINHITTEPAQSEMHQMRQHTFIQKTP